MKVKFLQGFGGRETNEIHYEKDQVANIDGDVAEDLIKRGIVVKNSKKEEPIEEPAIKVTDKLVKRPTASATKKGKNDEEDQL